jgi:uncharacterized membrane protein YqhA
MVTHLLRLRWIAAVVAVFCAADAIAFVGIGAVRAVQGYRILFEGPPWTNEHTPGIELARSLDAFLFAMVFVVFSIGVTTLFIVRPESPMLQVVPAWMRVKSLSHLKFLLWEAILATMVVASVESLVTRGSEPVWTVLAIPSATLVLAAGLFLSRRAH